jgi:hypothetical protein
MRQRHGNASPDAAGAPSHHCNGIPHIHACSSHSRMFPMFAVRILLILAASDKIKIDCLVELARDGLRSLLQRDGMQIFCNTSIQGSCGINKILIYSMSG